MAKQITQQTFDATVLDNIEEFEMSPDEAVADAIQQFEAQGVNLDMIIKIYQPKNDEGLVVHAPARAVSDLKLALEKTTPCDGTSVSAACDALRAVCGVSLADRCLAAKCGAYDVLMKALDSEAAGTACLLALLSALRALVEGQPDVLDELGATRLVDMIRQSATDRPEVLGCLLTIVRRCCLMHEANRQRFVQLGIIVAITDALSSNRSHRDVVRAACTAFSALTLDDDIRVPFGKGHEHAKAIVVEGVALDLLLDIATVYVDDAEVLGDIFVLIGKLSVRDEFCKKVLELGGVARILSILQSNTKNQGLVRSMLVVMKALAGSDLVKAEVVRAGGVALVVDAVRMHQYNAGVCEAGCAAVATVVLRFPQHCDAVVDANAPETICTTMELHSASAAVQKQACMAIRNIVARRPDLCDVFLRLGAENHLRRTLVMHATCHDEAHAALRDLGCKVELKELWTGAGRQLQQ